MRRITSILLVLAAGGAVEVLAHGGGLDANGCHTDRKTGNYHCHGTPRATAPRPAPAPATHAPASAAPVTLFSAPTPLPSPASAGVCGASPEEVRAAARMLLIGLGYLKAESPDISGAVLDFAIRNFQRDVFLEPSGQVNGQLLVRLAEETARRAKK